MKLVLLALFLLGLLTETYAFRRKNPKSSTNDLTNIPNLPTRQFSHSKQYTSTGLPTGKDEHKISGSLHSALDMPLRGGESVTEDPQGLKAYLGSGIFLLHTALLYKLFLDYPDTLEPTIGILALIFTTVTLGYDNFLIGIGKLLFADAKTNTVKRRILKVLSYPRFTAHAVLVPYLFVTVGEIGKALNISWLQSELVQTLLIVAATVLGVISRVRFVQSPGIELADTSDSPPGSLERGLIWFTYKEPEFLYVVPAILVSLFTIVVGGVSYFSGDGSTAAAVWMILAGATSLVGNVLPSHIMRFTGNTSEIALLWCMLEAAKLLN